MQSLSRLNRIAPHAPFVLRIDRIVGDNDLGRSRVDPQLLDVPETFHLIGYRFDLRGSGL